MVGTPSEGGVWGSGGLANQERAIRGKEMSFLLFRVFSGSFGVT